MQKITVSSFAIVFLASLISGLPTGAEPASQFSSTQRASGFQSGSHSRFVESRQTQAYESQINEDQTYESQTYESQTYESQTDEQYDDPAFDQTVEVDLSDLDSLKVTIPGIEVPAIALPTVKIPQVSIPKVKIKQVRVRRSQRPEWVEDDSQRRQIRQRPPYAMGVTPPFTCGRHLVTYRVQSLHPRAGLGIRCVKLSNGMAGYPRLAWYGEGQWQGHTYRHVGHAFGSAQAGLLIGSASDIYGNGEAARGNFPETLRVQVLKQGREIQVTGAWNERWIAVNQVAYQPLAAPVTCGSHFDEYRVVDAQGKRAGGGLRCMLRVGAENMTWFGNGQWNGNFYSHLGTRSQQGYGASDVCNPAFGSICNTFGDGSLHWQVVVRSRWQQDAQVRGAWREDWYARSQSR
jgi:hypothetical protein